MNFTKILIGIYVDYDWYLCRLCIYIYLHMATFLATTVGGGGGDIRNGLLLSLYSYTALEL